MWTDLNKNKCYVSSCNVMYGQVLTRDGAVYNERTMGPDLEIGCYWYFSSIEEAELFSEQKNEIHPDREYSIYCVEGEYIATYRYGKRDTRWKT